MKKNTLKRFFLFFRLVSVWVISAQVLILSNLAFAQDEFDDEFGDGFDSSVEVSPATPSSPSVTNSENPEISSSENPKNSNTQSVEGDSPNTENTEIAQEEYDTEDQEDPNSSSDGDEDEDVSLIVSDLETRLFLLSNTVQGAVGGVHIVDAGSSVAGSFRLQLVGEYFSGSSFLVEGDKNKRLGSTFSFGWTIFDFLEVFADTKIYGNQNSKGNPELLQSLGDFSFGVKGYYRILPWMTAGGDVRLAFLNGVGDVGPQNNATSAGIRINATADLQGLETPIPLIARFNLQYWIDNSARLIEGVENARYNALNNPNEPRVLESRHLISRIERFGLGINRTDFLNLGLGFEAPLQVYEDVFVSPILEWSIGIPFNREGFSCLLLEQGVDESASAEEDSCLAEKGASSFPQKLTLGFRASPIIKGLSALFAVDIGLSGTQDFVRELQPTMPYNLMFGLSYAVDTTPPPPLEPEIREIEVIHEVPVLPPLKGRVRGIAVDKASGAPIMGAVVQFLEKSVNPVVTNDDGTFVSYLFEPGEIAIDVSHPEYELGKCQAVISDVRPVDDVEETEGVAETRCELIAKPKVGALNIQVVSKNRKPVARAKVKVSREGSLLSVGKNNVVVTNARGLAELKQLSPGAYQVRVDAEGYLLYSGEIQVAIQKQTEMKIELLPKGKNVVQIKGKKLRLKGKLGFSKDGTSLSPRSENLIAELADFLIRKPTLKIQVQAHTDNRGGETRNRSVSQNEAEAVRQALVVRGVSPSQVEAKGFGSSRPLVPNITSRNRARNRRVDLVILSQ